MTDEEKIKELKKAFDDFLAKVAKFKQEHQEKISQILKEIDEEKLKQIRQKLGI